MVRLKIAYWEFDFEAMRPTLAHDILSQAHIHNINKQTKRTWTQGHFTVLHPPSGTGCQTHYKMQQTLHLFGSSEISSSSLPIWIHQFPVALLVSRHSFACRTNNVSFAAQHNVVKNNNNNHVSFMCYFSGLEHIEHYKAKKGKKLLLWEYMCVLTHTYTCVCAHAHIHMHVLTHTCTCVCACTRTHTCLCMRAHTHTHTHRVNFVMVFFHGHDESSKPVPSTSSDLVNNRQEGKQICEH